MASAERPGVSASNRAHGTHTPIVERLEFGPEHLCQHPTLASVEEQDSQHKAVVDLAPGARGERQVAQVGVKHRLPQPRKQRQLSQLGPDELPQSGLSESERHPG